jgi:hypothetical protein
MTPDTTIIIRILDSTLLGLTPVERWQAARRLDSSFMSDYGFVLVTAIVLVVLVVVLLWVSYSRISQGRRAAEQSFVENATKRGLSSNERDILRQIISHSGLEQGTSIFTTQDAFERGVAKLMQACVTKHTPQESEQLRAGLSFIREKLGFKPSVSPVSTGKARDASTRQIPVDKELQIERRKAHGSESIEAVVTENDDMAVTVKLATSLQTKPGDIWRAHYYFGSYVWEFDTSVVRSDGDILVLNHSEDVRSINRRRFSRVPVNKPALIASFPFFKTVKLSIGGGGRAKTKRRSASVLKDSWAVPKFVPAVVTELAGPGLRIEAPLEVKAGDRLLVVFELDNQAQKSSTTNSEAATSRIVGDIARVRRCTTFEKGFSIAVELMGLSDSNIDQLMQAAKPKVTEAVSSKADAGRDIPAHTDDEQTKQEVAQPGVMQGA